MSIEGIDSENVSDQEIFSSFGVEPESEWNGRSIGLDEKQAISDLALMKIQDRESTINHEKAVATFYAKQEVSSGKNSIELCSF